MRHSSLGEWEIPGKSTWPRWGTTDEWVSNVICLAGPYLDTRGTWPGRQGKGAQAQPSQGPPGLLLMGHNFKQYRILLGRGNNFKVIFCNCFPWQGSLKAHYLGWKQSLYFQRWWGFVLYAPGTHHFQQRVAHLPAPRSSQSCRLQAPISGRWPHWSFEPRN